MLVGAVGAGKSSLGNALCQKPSEPPPFRSRRSASGVTTACACAPCLAPGLGGAIVSSASERWWVVDTPGLRDGDDARAPEHLLRAIEACASPVGDINPTGGVDVFLLVFNATGRVSSGDLEAIETLKRRFGAARFLERAVAVFTHADVLIADDGDAKDDEDENEIDEIAASYLRDAPPALASLLRAAVTALVTGTSGESVPAAFKILRKLKFVADATDETARHGLYVLSDIALLAFHKEATKRGWDTGPFPGQVAFPRAFFTLQQKAATNNATEEGGNVRVGDYSHLPVGFEIKAARHARQAAQDDKASAKGAGKQKRQKHQKRHLYL